MHQNSSLRLVWGTQEAGILLIEVLFSRYRFLSIFGTMEASTKSANMHIGRKIGRIRELRGIKEILAEELGVSQQTVSRMEQSEVVEKELLEKVAKILGVSPYAIKNFSEEAVVNYFNTFNDSSVNQGAVGSNNHQYCTFNPLDKLMEVVEENKKLYERLLASEREKIELLKGKQ